MKREPLKPGDRAPMRSKARKAVAFKAYCEKKWVFAGMDVPGHCFRQDQEGCGMCGIEWLSRRLRRIAKRHGYVTKYHREVFENWLNQALCGERGRKGE